MAYIITPPLGSPCNIFNFHFLLTEVPCSGIALLGPGQCKRVLNVPLTAHLISRNREPEGEHQAQQERRVSDRDVQDGVRLFESRGAEVPR